jgi:hypothetical protein
MQFPDGAQIEVQVFRIELEALCELINGLLELHQGDADVLDFFRGERLFFEASDGLPLHQLANEFDEAEHELDDRPLHIFRLRIPTQRLGATWAFGALAAWGSAFARRFTRLPRRSSPAFFRAKAGHALGRFALPSLAAGVPITFLISLIRSCGRHGLVITTSQPALFALSEWPVIA